MKLKFFLLRAFLFLGILAQAQNVEGELRRWHKVTLTFNGPNTNETATPNPFTDFRFDVTFTHQNDNVSYTVPGYYAACGNADNTSCNSGNKWRVHFTPDRRGTWNWVASFKSGSDIAITSGGRSGGFMDGDTGRFVIRESNKSGKDFRNKDLGRLKYVGEHYLRHTGTNPTSGNGPWFVKAGADSPENVFNYVDFDATPSFLNNLNLIGSKTWSAHQRDYIASEASSYTWRNGTNSNRKGTELLGVINYLSTEGANVMSFLTWNTGGDDGSVFPHILRGSIADYEGTPRAQQWGKMHQDRFDVSKLAQWENILEYADRKGVYLHFKTMETENDNLMDGNRFGRQRKLYYRELIARFSHHLALNWNLTEESTLRDAVVIETAAYIKNLDPYNHHIVIHTFPTQHDQRYTPLLGNNSELTGASIQADRSDVHNDVRTWVQRSRNSGKKWVVANDEQGHANIGIRVPEKQVREEVLWASLMAGGAGVEYYSGYTPDDGDINGADHRKRGSRYREGGYALDFFNENLQDYMTRMVSSDGVTADTNDYVFAKRGDIYAVYRPDGGSTALSLPSGNSNYTVQWYNPRTGNNLTAARNLGARLVAPNNTTDWVALIKNKNLTSTPTPTPTTKTVTLSPLQDAYRNGTNSLNNRIISVQPNRRIGYLKFNLSQINGTITSAELKLKVVNNAGDGLIRINQGNNTRWTERNLTAANLPVANQELGRLNKTYNLNDDVDFQLSGIRKRNFVTFIVTQVSGDNVSFGSKENGNTSRRPQLVITYTENTPKKLDIPAKIIIGPNPTVNGVTLTIEDDLVGSTIDVYSIDGTLIKTVTANSREFYINLANVSSGMYILRLSNNNGFKKIFKVIKK